MGSNSSKPTPQSSQHVFASDTPVRFSQELIDSLQISRETDSTRSKALELHIQSRVADELKQLEARETQALRELEERISAEAAESDADASAHKHGSDGEALLRRSESLGSDAVQREIATLRQRLEGRKRLDKLNEAVERAKGDVVRCLREKDRRPLDCWREVEAFKMEVARLERKFVDRALR